MRALTLAEVAAEFGRSTAWMANNWPALVAAKKLPPPVNECGRQVWNAAQVYAVLDKPLTPAQRAAAAAYRIAEAAIEKAALADDGGPDILARRRALEQQYSQEGAA
jgi:hypothetical protein